MIDNNELLDLLETEGSIEYLFLEHGLTTDELQDFTLADLIEEILPTLKEIHTYLDFRRRERDGEE